MSISRQEAKVKILAKLLRHHNYGEHYVNVHTALSKVPRDAWDVGEDAMQELVQDGILEEHKNGDCVSINPAQDAAVEGLLQGAVPDYFITHYLEQHVQQRA